MECIFFTNKKTNIEGKNHKRRNSFNLVFKSIILSGVQNVFRIRTQYAMSCHGDQITNPKIWLDRHFCLVRRIVRIGLDAKTTKKKIKKKRKHLRSHEKCLCGQESMINSIRIAMATSWDGRGTFKGVWLTWGIHMYSAPPWVLIWITSKLYMKPWPSTHTFIRNLAN